MMGISQLDERLLGSEEGPCSIDLVLYENIMYRCTIKYVTNTFHKTQISNY
jgi:hypothetical protein